MKFSIVICVYNPGREIFERVLHACANQVFEKSEYEILIIDNNSNPPLASRDYIAPLLTSKFRCIVEPMQGLTFARICGIKTAVAGFVLFVDDDNVLDPDYLSGLEKLFAAHPGVGAWGPGKIRLDYIHGAPTWIKKHYGGLFQQKDKIFTQFGCVVGWPDYYPAGTGLSVRKDILTEYVRQFENGQLSFTGRNLGGLESAEDSQMIWIGVKMGYCAGTSPQLKLTHVIPSKRVTRPYLARLNHAIGISFTRAIVEIFPEMKNTFEKRSVHHKINFIIKLILRSRGNPILFYRFFTIENGWFRGVQEGLVLKPDSPKK